MDIDVIVVLCLALLFFGGIGYLSYRERNKKTPQDAVTPAAETPVAKTPAEPRENGPRKKGRKKKKS
jgi:hypothetical protein